MNDQERLRFDRLMRGLGEDGFGKLQKSMVTVVFDSDVGRYFALPFAASGIPLRLISASQKDRGDKLIDIDIEDDSRARGYTKAFNKFNNTNIDTVAGAEAELGFYGAELLLHPSSVVIDCTNDPQSKMQAADYCSKNKTAFISSSVAPGYGKLEMMAKGNKPHTSLLMNGMETLDEKVFSELRRKHKSMKGAKLTKEIVAMFLGGIAADEAVKVILEKGEPLTKPQYCKFGYGADVFTPKTAEDELKHLDISDFDKSAALIFGAGAVGANTGYWLARMGLGQIDFLDYDVVEKSNIIRTLLFHDREGWAKNSAAADKVVKISPNSTKSRAIQTRITEDWTPDHKYDLYVDGFDNFYSRMIVSNLAMKTFTPLLSASGRFDAFDVEVYIPNETLCFDCNFGINKLGRDNEATIRQGCGMEFMPQNTWINQSVGALNAMMLASMLNPEKYGAPVNGMVLYDSNQENRLYVNEKEGACIHRKGGAIDHNVR